MHDRKISLQISYLHVLCNFWAMSNIYIYIYVIRHYYIKLEKNGVLNLSIFLPIHLIFVSRRIMKIRIVVCLVLWRTARYSAFIYIRNTIMQILHSIYDQKFSLSNPELHYYKRLHSSYYIIYWYLRSLNYYFDFPAARKHY